MQDFITILYPVLLTFLAGFMACMGNEVLKLAPKIIDFVVAKIGLTNYQKSKLVALDIWNVIEEHFRLNEIIGDTVQSKITMFETLIKQKIPGITNANIELLRQAIAGEVNKDKPMMIKAIETPAAEPVITVATPIVKYFAPDGITELVPVTAPTVIESISTPTPVLNPIDGQPII